MELGFPRGQRPPRPFAGRVNCRVGGVVLRPLLRAESPPPELISLPGVLPHPPEPLEDLSIAYRGGELLAARPWIRDEGIEVEPLGNLEGPGRSVAEDAIRLPLQVSCVEWGRWSLLE